MGDNEKQKMENNAENINKLRNKIDDIDKKIIELIKDRTYIVNEIWNYKNCKNN